MGTRAKSGACLVRLAKEAVPLLREAERRSPRTGPGAKPDIPDWLIGVLIMVAIIKRKKSKSAQFRFLKENRQLIATATGSHQFPSRSTFFRRYRRAHQLFRAGIRLQGELAIAEGVADPRDLAVDKSLMAALGPPWHQQDRKAGKVPRGVDCDSTWGYSEHDGWVHGYSYEVVVSATPRSTVFPLLASVDSASAAEVRTFADKVVELPPETRTVSADSGYDANILGERVEYNDHGRRTGRHFLCPQNPRNTANRRLKRCTTPSQAHSRFLRNARNKFLKSPRGRRVYARRKKTVEPFNQWFKSLFELDTHVWHRGVNNNRTQILGAVFAYQLLVRHNFHIGRNNGRVRWIIDAL